MAIEAARAEAQKQIEAAQAEAREQIEAAEAQKADARAQEQEARAEKRSAAVEKAQARGATKVAERRRAESIAALGRSEARLAEATAVMDEARRMKSDVQSQVRGGVSRLQLITTVVSVIATVITGLGWYSAQGVQADEQRANAELREGAMAELREDYIVLPNPSDITSEPATSPISQTSDYYNNYFLVTDHRYYTNEALGFSDLIPGDTVECWSPECETVLRRAAEARFETVYLRIENIGVNEASDIRLTLQPYSSNPTELEHFTGVFSSPQEADEIVLDGMPTLRQGEGILIPLAAVAVFEPGGGRSFIGMRDTRKPTVLTWRDSELDRQESRPVRDIRQMVLIGGEVPGGG